MPVSHPILSLHPEREDLSGTVGPFRMNNLRAILFPHASLPEESLRRALSFFGPLKVCQPWYTPRPVSFPLEGAIQVLQPPPALRPPGDFQRLLAEYRSWIRVNQKQGHDALLAFSQEKGKSGEAVWDIRGSLRSNHSSPVIAFQEKALQWHLTLHLSQELDDQEREAERLLRDLREKPSPLKDLLDEGEEAGHPLKDLRGLRKEPSRKSIDQVLEAWISLFEGHIEGDDFLLTFSQETFHRFDERWDGEGEAGSLMIEFRSPDFSHLGFEEIEGARRSFLESEEGMALRESVIGLQKALPMRPPEEPLRRRQAFAGNRMKITLRRLPSVPFSGGPMGRFSGKTIVLIGEEHPHDG